MQHDEYAWYRTGRGIVEELDRECLRFDEMSCAPCMRSICMSMDLKADFINALIEGGKKDEIFKGTGLFVFGVQVVFMPEWPEHTIRVY